jgi:hypothetical protein
MMVAVDDSSFTFSSSSHAIVRHVDIEPTWSYNLVMFLSISIIKPHPWPHYLHDEQTGPQGGISNAANV